MGCVPAPLHCVLVKSRLLSGFFPVTVLPRFPIDGIDFIMRNDIAGGKGHPTPEVVEVPITSFEHDELAEKHPDIFSALTADSLPPVDRPVSCSVVEPDRIEAEAPTVPLPLTRDSLISGQKSDRSLNKCFSAVPDGLKSGQKQSFVLDDGLLMRRWAAHPDPTANGAGEDWSTIYQIVVPVECRQHVLRLVHEHPVGLVIWV